MAGHHHQEGQRRLTPDYGKLSGFEAATPPTADTVIRASSYYD
jgi:hypothetical protein